MEQVEHNYRIEDITLLRSNSQRISRTIIEGVENLTYSISDKTENFLLYKRGSEEPHLTVVRDTFSNTRQKYPQIYRKYIQKLFDSIDPYIDIDFAERDFIKISENSTNSDINIARIQSTTLTSAGGTGIIDNNSSQGWALWSEQNKNKTDPSYGEQASKWIIGHEIGHVLGLSHYENRPENLAYDHIISIMDYDTAGVHAGFSALDKAALQDMYGIERDFSVISTDEEGISIYTDESGNIFVETDIHINSLGRPELMYRGATETKKFEYLRAFDGHRMNSNRRMTVNGEVANFEFVTAKTKQDPISGENNFSFYRSQNTLETWSMDADWYASSLNRDPISAGKVLELENEFKYDLNGDNIVGTKLIESSGSLQLHKANKGLYYAQGTGENAKYSEIKNTHGNAVRESRNWDLIGIDIAPTRNARRKGIVAVWKNKNNDRLSAWHLNQNYEKKGKGYTLVGDQLGKIETAFEQDLNENGIVGNVHLSIPVIDLFARF